MNNLAALREKLRDGRLVKGVFITMADLSVSEMAGYAGYDFVWLDGEHAPLDRQELFRHILAAQSAGACAFVRVAGVDPYQVKAVLDMGPDGIIFPFVDSGELAARAVKACRYPPAGLRGQGPVRAIRYGLEDEAAYIADAENRVLKILQVESLAGYENLDDILAAEGADSIFIGGADLGRSLAGSPVEGRDFETVFADICRRVRAKGLVLGCATGPSAEDIRPRVEQGVQWVVFGQDARILSGGLKANLQAVTREFP